MQHDGHRAAVLSRLKRQLRIHERQKEVSFGFRKNFEFRLTGELSEEVSIFAADGEGNLRCELIPPDKRVELLRLERDLDALFWRLQWKRGIQQMTSDVVH